MRTSSPARGLGYTAALLPALVGFAVTPALFATELRPDGGGIPSFGYRCFLKNATLRLSAVRKFLLRLWSSPGYMYDWYGFPASLSPRTRAW